MVSRIVALLGALAMVCTSPFASAWDADSFVQDSPDYYRMFSAKMPSISIMADSSSVSSSFDCSQIFHNGSWVTSSRNLAYLYVHFPDNVPNPDLYLNHPFPSFSSSDFFKISGDSSSGTAWQTPFYSVPLDLYSDYEILGVRSPHGESIDSETTSLTYQLDISSFGDFSAFEIGGNLSIGFGPHSSTYEVLYNTIVEMNLLVDGTVYQTFRPDSDNHFTLSSTLCTVTQNISSVSFQFVFKYDALLDYVASSTYNGYILVSYPSTFYFTVLSNDEILNGYNDEAQDSINSHEQVESEWVQTSSDNFSALDIENFSIPSSLLSGFALISGIFTDIWNGLGDYRVVFVLPLTLGVILVVVGRIARTAGSQSSRNKGGDGNA